MPRIHLATNPGEPYRAVKRKMGKLNAGLYCEQCPEFFALAVVPKAAEHVPVEIVADGLILFECPFCKARQARDVSEIVQIRLTALNKRKPQSIH